MILTARFDEAMAYAIDKHRTQERKGSGAPYVTHLIAVASLVGEYGGDEEQMMAGLLHDVIEDQGVTEAELAGRFGQRVARIVVACTDSFVMPKPPWKERKTAYLDLLRKKDPEVKLVSACDKLHNAASIARDLARPDVGKSVWTRFTASREQSLWYYRSLVEALADGWPHPVLTELDRTVRVLESE
jgi:(p)ppGpp synthase/HD superfamily hydrolase